MTRYNKTCLGTEFRFFSGAIPENYSTKYSETELAAPQHVCQHPGACRVLGCSRPILPPSAKQQDEKYSQSPRPLISGRKRRKSWSNPGSDSRRGSSCIGGYELDQSRPGATS